MTNEVSTDTIHELELSVKRLIERVDQTRREVARIEAAHVKTAEVLARTVTDLAVLHEWVSGLKKAPARIDYVRWAVTVAVVGSFLALAGNIAVTLLRK
jgi:hypothetical protein